MKKQYKTANIGHKEYVESAAETTAGGGAVFRSLLKIDDSPDGKGFNAKIINGEFSLPPASESQEQTIEVAHRILGILVGDKLLGHLPATVTSEHIGTLLPFYPIGYHRRFGDTYTDRICLGSTRTGRCPACDGRMELFKSDAYRNGALAKEQIMDAGFGTRNVAVVISRVYFNGEDLGIRVWTTPLTNEFATNAKHDNFFDLIQQLTSPKKLLAGETLPEDYYANGDGARWLVAEYVRATYQDSGKNEAAQRTKRPPRPYWKLSKITPVKQIQGVGKAEDIWWPEISKKDGTELVDVYTLVNHTDKEELAQIAQAKVKALLNPRESERRSETPEGSPRKEDGREPETQSDITPPTWDDIVDMQADELVQYGAAKGGNRRDLELTGKTNVAALRRCVAKMWGVTPKPVGSSRQTAEESDTQLF